VLFKCFIRVKQHTFATNLVERGVDILVVARLLGHSEIKTSMIYAKVGEAIKRHAIEKLGDEPHDGHKMVTLDLLAGKLEDDRSEGK